MIITMILSHLYIFDSH